MSTVDAGANVSGRGSAPVDDLASRREWMEHGTRLLLGAVDGLPDADLDAAIALEGWTRRHLVAHLAANADALGNLVRWAATGVETPMYASTTQRADDIEAGSTRPVGELRTWLSASVAECGVVSAEGWPDPAVRGLRPDHAFITVRVFLVTYSCQREYLA